MLSNTSDTPKQRVGLHAVSHPFHSMTMTCCKSIMEGRKRETGLTTTLGHVFPDSSSLCERGPSQPVRTFGRAKTFIGPHWLLQAKATQIHVVVR